MSDTRPSKDLVARLRQAVSTYNDDDEELFTLAADEIERLQRELNAAFQMLEVCGVPRQRARTVANGISVLDSRYQKQATADEPSSALTATLCPECGWVGEFKPTLPPQACVHPWEHVGINADGHPFCAECGTNLTKDPPWKDVPDQPPSEWRPIETAPADTPVLVWWPHWGPLRPFIAEVYMGKWRSYERTSDIGPDKPDAWMPLPTPPTKEEIPHVASLGDMCICLACVEDREWVKGHAVPKLPPSQGE